MHNGHQNVNGLFGVLELVQRKFASLHAEPTTGVAEETLSCRYDVEIVQNASSAKVGCNKQESTLD